VAVLATLLLGGCAPPGPRADYRFQNTLASSTGTGNNLLNIEVNGNANTFQTEQVDGSSRTVLRFPQDNGLALYGATNVVSSTVYTMAVLLRFDTVSGWRRVFDVKNGESDSGLYVVSGNLRFYPRAGGTSAPVVANSWVQVVLTRDSAKKVTGYVNGAQQFQFTDSLDEGVVSENVLRWFRDNYTGGTTGEASSGSVARIRLWNRALSAGEVSGLSRLS